MGFLDKLKNLIRFAEVTGPADNNAQFPVQQMRYKGKVVNVLQVFPYGTYANILSDSALGLMLSIDGSENNRAAISYTPQLRPTDLDEGEIAHYHPQTKTFIKFRNNGNLEISTIPGQATGDLIINVQNATINANDSVDVNCIDATISASSSTTVDSPTTTLTGNLQVDGNITTDGSITAQGEVTGNGIDLSTHNHIGSPTAPSGIVSNTGAPV